MVKNCNNQNEINRLIRYLDTFPVEYHESMVLKQPLSKFDSLQIDIDAIIFIDRTHATICPGAAAKIKNHFIIHSEMAFYMVVNIFFSKPSRANKRVVQSRSQIHGVDLILLLVINGVIEDLKTIGFSGFPTKLCPNKVELCKMNSLVLNE